MNNKIVVTTQKEWDALFKIFSKSKLNKKSGCWEHSGKTDKYKSFYFKEKHFDSHRLVAQICLGKSKKDVMHLCNNKKCVNPSHLKYGTRSENLKHSVMSGKIKTGFDSPYSVLDKKKALFICETRKLGWSFANIASVLKCHTETVRRSYLRSMKHNR